MGFFGIVDSNIYLEVEEMGWSSRTVHLEKTLQMLDMPMALDAFYLVIEEMCEEKGFVRHNGAHYYHHLVDVTQELINFGIGTQFVHPSVIVDFLKLKEWKERLNITDEDILTAALLHDLKEDVIDPLTNKPKFDVDWLENRYNKQVALMVDSLSKKPNIDYKKPKNIKRYLHQNSLHVGTALIKTCDCMNNMSTLENAPIEKRNRKAFEVETYFFDFFETCRDKYPFYSYIFFKAKTQIESFLWLLKKEYQMHLEIEELKSQFETKNPKT